MTRKILVSVKTRCAKPFVEKTDDAHFIVGVKAMPVDGAANEAVIAALADYLHISKTLISIKLGKKSKKKVLEIQ